MRTMSEISRLLVHSLDQGYDRKAWHGPNLRGALRGLNARQALWRPARGRHNIWEIAVHCAYWKYAVRQRITGGRRGAFQLKGSNWFGRSGNLNDGDWKSDLRILESEHRALKKCIVALPLARLFRKASKSKYSVLELVTGIAAHDVYHAGQIRLLKRLMTARPGRQDLTPRVVREQPFRKMFDAGRAPR